MTQKKASQAKTKVQEDEYTLAVRPVVDEAMQAHNLAPAIKNAIVENLPLNEELQKVIVKTMQRNPDAKEAIDKIVTENRQVKRDKLVVGAISVVATAVVGGVITFIVNLATK